MKTHNFTKYRWMFLGISLAIILAGIIMLKVHNGFNFDVEFLGGTRMQVNIGKDFNNEEVSKDIMEKLNLSATVQKSGDNNTEAVIKVQSTDDNEKAKNDVMSILKEKFPDTVKDDTALISSSTASASFGLEVQRKALLYTLIAVICMLIYIIIRFEIRSAVMCVATLALDIFVMAAVYAIFYIPVNTTFVAAMLTIVGYSINNSIVIFDRIRENAKARKKTETFIEMVNRSVGETLGRTLNSTITTLITVVVIYILGVNTLKEFALPLIIGLTEGAYSSIFIGSTFWGTWTEASAKAKAEAAAERRAANKSSKKK